MNDDQVKTEFKKHQDEIDRLKLQGNDNAQAIEYIQPIMPGIPEITKKFTGIESSGTSVDLIQLASGTNSLSQATVGADSHYSTADAANGGNAFYVDTGLALPADTPIMVNAFWRASNNLRYGWESTMPGLLGTNGAITCWYSMKIIQYVSSGNGNLWVDFYREASNNGATNHTMPASTAVYNIFQIL